MIQSSEHAKPLKPQQATVFSELFSEQDSLNSLRSPRNSPQKDKGILQRLINENLENVLLIVCINVINAAFNYAFGFQMESMERSTTELFLATNQ